VQALPKLIDENSRIHTTFNQDVAATGRLSSTDPNLQNIPVRTEMGRKIRDAFVPEKGNVFVNADYSQFELRLAAMLAGDEKMINDFNAGTDIHAKTAAEVYKVPLDNVTKAQRSAAKVVNFGVLYGMSIHGLVAATGMTFVEAKAFIDEYNKVRVKLVDYTKSIIKLAHEAGYVETLYGRRRPTPDVNSSNFAVRNAAERAAANMPIQGTEADLMKKAMVVLDEKISGLGEQLLQVHDSILVECPKANADKIAEILQDTMENIAPDLGVKLQVDVHVGDNWGEV
jgi:DNA polymerase-1